MNKIGAAILLVIAVTLAGCGRKPAPSVNAEMTQVMSPQAQTVWDITSRAFNADGDGLDESKISPADWVKLGKAGRLMKARSRALAKTKHVAVVHPGETVLGAFAAPGGPTKQTWDAANDTQILAMIEANPILFAQRARVMTEAADTLVKASLNKDVRKLYEVSSNLDEVCDGCHQKFWGTDEPPPLPIKGR